MDLSNKETMNKLLLGLLVAMVFIVGFNALRLSALSKLQIGGEGNIGSLTGAAVSGNSGSTSNILPKGIPAIYGKELGISFDDVSAADPEKADATIRKLGMLDQTIILNEAQKQRYINALYMINKGISCEYCCGAKAVIFADGQPACGCAHRYAMRGLAKYLLTKHASEFTDEQIQEEAGKWKALFFPGQIELKAQILASNGIELNFINLASNKYRGIEQGAGKAGGMVGGC